ncbi:Predicted ATP-binding protein involved in virulence [Klebsiella pneumoniae]|nr:ATP-binding protein [Klebsiella pneumoniae]SAV60629.1 Predicted ATP-binding protein involved in virulence [Klebsiella pneumoniae]
MEGRGLITDVSVENKAVKLIIDTVSEEENYFSIIVGVNGSGKSRILEAISTLGIFIPTLFNTEGCVYHTFEKITNVLMANESDPIISMSMSYLSGGDENSIRIETKINHFDYYDSISEIWFNKNNEVPKIICISNSLSNRFPRITDNHHALIGLAGSNVKNLSISEDYRISRYEAYKNIIEESLSKEIIKSFFSNEGYFKQSVEFLGNFGFSGGVLITLKAHNNLFGVTEKGVGDERELKERIRSINKFNFPFDGNDDELMSEIINNIDSVFKVLLQSIKTKEDNWDVNYFDTYFFRDGTIGSFSFDTSEYVKNDLHEKISFLAKYGIIKLKECRIARGGNPIIINKMSSGELNLLLLMFKINGEICDNSIIMIDEPEISLHPAWQKKIVPELTKCFSKYKGCHFIIATHSPQVVASIPKSNSCVVMLGEYSKTIPGADVHGKSSDFQLFNTLNYAGDSNEYIIRELLLIVAKYDSSQSIDKKDIDFIKHAKLLLEDVGDDDVAKYLLRQTLALISPEGECNE